MNVNLKSHPGHAFVFLNCGPVQSVDEIDDRWSTVMSAMGWISIDDIDGLRRALADAEQAATTQPKEPPP